jgi:hypothetical protein
MFTDILELVVTLRRCIDPFAAFAAAVRAFKAFVAARSPVGALNAANELSIAVIFFAA